VLFFTLNISHIKKQQAQNKHYTPLFFFCGGLTAKVTGGGTLVVVVVVVVVVDVDVDDVDDLDLLEGEVREPSTISATALSCCERSFLMASIT